jgi:hypothetical protein
MGTFDLPDFIVVPDTNALHTKKPAQIVSSGFDSLWNECSQITTLKLFVPDIVKQELMFQQVFIAQQSRENALKNLNTMAEITGTTMPKLKTDEQLHSSVGITFEKWRKAIEAEIVPLPKDIPWTRLVKDALWRNPPFSPSKETDDRSEKGFRDALILETLRQLWKVQPDKQIVFLSGDDLLRSTAETRAGKNKNRLVFPALREFHAYLKLLKEERGQKFNQTVMENASQVFYTANDGECVYYKFRLYEKVLKEQLAHLNTLFDPQPQAAINFPPSMVSQSFKFWRPISEEKPILVSTRFSKILDDKRWLWRTQMNFAKLCAYEETNPAQNAYPGIFTSPRQIRIAKFDILWSSTVSSDAKVTNPEYIAIEPMGKDFESPSADKCAQYNLTQEMGFGQIAPTN